MWKDVAKTVGFQNGKLCQKFQLSVAHSQSVPLAQYLTLIE